MADLALLGRVVAQTRTARAILEQRGTYPVRTVVTEPGSGIEVPPLEKYVDQLVAFMQEHPEITAEAMV